MLLLPKETLKDHASSPSRELRMAAQFAPASFSFPHERWPAPGLQFGNGIVTYEITKYLGDSAAIVYECHLVSEPTKIFAVKIYDPMDYQDGQRGALRDFEADRESFRAFEASQQCMYGENDRNLIVQKYDHFQNNVDGCHFLVMEKIRDVDCAADLLEELRRRGSGFDEDVAKNVFKQLLGAVEWVHKQNYIHRDLKLANILIEKKRDRHYDVKLTDFGVSKCLNSRLGMASTRRGTPNMTPPELDEHAGLYKGRPVDMWGLGVILYTMVMAEDFPGPKVATRKGELEIEQCSIDKWEKLPEALRSMIKHLLRWEADPAGFCPRMDLEECKNHRWLQGSQTPPPTTPSYKKLMCERNSTWTSSRPYYFCQKLQVTEKECDGCSLYQTNLLAQGSCDNKCLGIAAETKRQVLSIRSCGVYVQRTQQKNIIRHGDTVYYGVANTPSKDMEFCPAKVTAYHPEFEGRLCRNIGVGFGWMECVEFRVPRFMHDCVIGNEDHRGNDESLGWIKFRNNYGGLTIALLRKADGTEVAYPMAGQILHEGDTLFIPRRFVDDLPDSSDSVSWSFFTPFVQFLSFVTRSSGDPEYAPPEIQWTEEEIQDENICEERISMHAFNFESEDFFEDIALEGRVCRARTSSEASQSMLSAVMPSIF